MGLTWTKKHVASVVEVLDADHPDVDSAARAALDAALSIIEDRAKFAVLGQVYETPEHGAIAPDHEAAVKVCLGFFESDTKANDAASSMTFNTSGDMLRTWVVPTFFGTPAAWHKERRDYYAALEEKANDKRREKMRVSIAKRHAETEARAVAITAMETEAGQGWPCPTTRVKRGECRHEPGC